jgi:hypothetical protein
MRIVKMEERAPLRLYVAVDNKEYEISMHYVFAMLCLQRGINYVACSRRFKPLIDYIERTHNIKIELPNTIDVYEARTAQAIKDAEKTNKKYRWGADPRESGIPVL